MSQASIDEHWMQVALECAARAAEEGEVPVGAVLVRQDQPIATAWNQPITLCDPSAHAEILVLRAGAKALQNYRLPETTLYVSLEPCLMCAGALVHARVQRVVFGAFDPKAGVISAGFNVVGHSALNHAVDYQGGVLAEASAALLQDFFRARR